MKTIGVAPAADRAARSAGSLPAASRISTLRAAPVGTPRMWTLGYGHHKDRTPTHGYEATREAAMAAVAKSWRRE